MKNHSQGIHQHPNEHLFFLVLKLSDWARWGEGTRWHHHPWGGVRLRCESEVLISFHLMCRFSYHSFIFLLFFSLFVIIVWFRQVWLDIEATIPKLAYSLFSLLLCVHWPFSYTSGGKRKKYCVALSKGADLLSRGWSLCLAPASNTHCLESTTNKITHLDKQNRKILCWCGVTCSIARATLVN